ncbi:MAG: FtsX-like permease family protein, partial [Acidimicrobiales bacterium]
GPMTARLFLWRWNLRLLRRERRQHAAFVVLIATAVTLSVAGVLSAYHLVEPPENAFGTAEVIAATVGDSSAAQQALIDQEHMFAVIHTIDLPIEGSARRVPIRVQDPENEVGRPLLDLLDGRWPVAAGEVAVTDRVAIGDTTTGRPIGTTIELGDEPFLVVGLIENPTDLSDEFVLAHRLDQFDVPISDHSSRYLVDAEPAEVTFPAGSGRITLASRGGLLAERTAVALAVGVVAAVAMFEVALLIGAGFAVLARRRSRQYGLLGAVGATPRQLRAAAATAGTIIGLLGAAIGAVVGLAIAAVITPSLETTVGHRIDFSVPWWTVVPAVVLAVASATVAARWPSRPLSRQPIAHLLASLRPRPSPVGRSTVVGAVLAVVGSLAVVVGFARLNTAIAAAGIVLAPIGLLLLAPLLVRLIGRWSGRLPMAARLGGRAIARHDRRSAAVVAALAVALGIPVGVAVVSASVDAYDLTKAPNLDERSLIAWMPGAEQPIPHIPADLVEPDVAESLAPTTVAALTAAVPGARVAAIEVAVRPEAVREQETFDRIGSQAAIIPVFAAERGTDCFNCDVYGFGDRDPDGNEILYISADAWLATPELMTALGIDGLSQGATAISRSAAMSVADSDGLIGSLGSSVAVEPTIPAETGIAPLLLSPDVVAAQGFDRVTVGRVVVSDQPLSAEVREAAVAALGGDLFAEFRDEPSPRSTLRLVGLLAGMAVALGIAVSAVGLLTAEAADDLRILQSIGASPTTARALSASVAAILAGAGALIAVLIGYLALLPLLTIDEIDFPFVVPWPSLAGFLLVFPALAAGIGWLTNNRQPTTLARPS